MIMDMKINYKTELVLFSGKLVKNCSNINFLGQSVVINVKLRRMRQ